MTFQDSSLGFRGSAGRAAIRQDARKATEAQIRVAMAIVRFMKQGSFYRPRSGGLFVGGGLVVINHLNLVAPEAIDVLEYFIG